VNAWFSILLNCALALAFSATSLVIYAVASDPKSVPRRAFSAYAARLDRDLDLLFRPRRGRRIALAQAGSMICFVGLAVAAHTWAAGVLVLVVALAPRLLLRRALARKRTEIEQNLPGVAKTLANCLRTTPNLVAALEQTQRLSPPGIARELDLVLGEMQVGSTLEPALLRMGARLGSGDLDAILTGIVITRQVGGNLPDVLETLASSLREMARLAGVLRSKTADARTQFLLVVLMPPALVIVLEKILPGHVDELFKSTTGLVICLISALLWMGSVLLARKILAVQL
jgi:tight adherence protein B